MIVKQIYAVQSVEELEIYQESTQKLYPRLEMFINFLQAEYQASDFPR